MSANLESTAEATGLEKVSFHSNPKERQCQKCLNYHTIALISHASKVMLKILQARLQQYVNCEPADVQAGLNRNQNLLNRKGRGARGQIANIHWIIRKEREFQKNIYSHFIDYAKALCGSQRIVENSSRDGNTRLPDLPPEEICMLVRK